MGRGGPLARGPLVGTPCCVCNGGWVGLGGCGPSWIGGCGPHGWVGVPSWMDGPLVGRGGPSWMDGRVDAPTLMDGWTGGWALMDGPAPRALMDVWAFMDGRALSVGPHG